MIDCYFRMAHYSNHVSCLIFFRRFEKWFWNDSFFKYTVVLSPVWNYFRLKKNWCSNHFLCWFLNPHVLNTNVIYLYLNSSRAIFVSDVLAAFSVPPITSANRDQLVCYFKFFMFNFLLHRWFARVRWFLFNANSIHITIPCLRCYSGGQIQFRLWKRKVNPRRTFTQ